MNMLTWLYGEARDQVDVARKNCPFGTRRHHEDVSMSDAQFCPNIPFYGSGAIWTRILLFWLEILSKIVERRVFCRFPVSSLRAKT